MAILRGISGNGGFSTTAGIANCLPPDSGKEALAAKVSHLAQARTLPTHKGDIALQLKELA